MIKPLRKRHLQVWIVLAILMPVGVIGAYRAIPKQAIDKLLQEDKSMALPLEIKKVGTKNYTVYLRSSNDKKHYQLQWNVIDASTVPSSLIYQVNDAEKELVGRVATAGNYYFPLNANAGPYKFVLYDIIRHQAIDTIKF